MGKYLTFLTSAPAHIFLACSTIPGAMSVIKMLPEVKCLAREMPGSPAPLATSITLGLDDFTTWLAPWMYTEVVVVRTLKRRLCGSQRTYMPVSET